MLDDADRDDERQIVAEWTAHPGFVAVHHPYAEKGLAVLEFASTTG